MDKEMAPKDCLFEAIVNIKKSHNKPNTAWICSYLLKKYNITANRCIKAINHYTLTGDIVTVNPGASTAHLSYRVADNPIISALDDLPSLQGSLINKFMAELIINTPNYLNDGVPPGKLVQFIEEKQTNLTRQEILDSIQAELRSGNLDTFENGNYGYNPVDSSDEEPLSETEEKKAKLELAEGGRSTPTTPTTRRPTAPSGVKQNSPIGVKPATPSGVKSTAAGNVDRPLEGRRERRVAPPTAKESPVTPREERKENVRKEEVEEKKKTPGWKLKKRKCYVERDEDFQPASKDFKVDLSLERQARKRKEKKIFDPSALDSKGTRRGRNGLKGSGQDVKDSSTTSTVGGKKMISPVKKFSSGASAKVSPPVVQVPPGGRTNITPLVPSTVCYLCQTYGKRIKGVPEKLICCVKCSVSKVHISCLNDARLPTEKAISTSSSVPHTWSCRKCNLHCVYCNQNKPGVSILECIECKSGFHIPCHWSLIPPPCKTLVLTPTTFKCVRCVPPLQQASQIVEKPPEKPPAPEVKPKPSAVAPAPAAPSVGAGGDSAPPKVMVTNLKPKVNSMAAQIGDSGTAPTDTRPPLTPSGLRIPGVVKLEDPYADIPIDESIPDCRSWTALEVYNYMRLYLQPHVCRPLLDGEIDGSALLLLKRSDCIQILGLPLGFGLKLWSHVKRLQTKRSEIEIYWE